MVKAPACFISSIPFAPSSPMPVMITPITFLPPYRAAERQSLEKLAERFGSPGRGANSHYFLGGLNHGRRHRLRENGVGGQFGIRFKEFRKAPVGQARVGRRPHGVTDPHPRFFKKLLR